MRAKSFPARSVGWISKSSTINPVELKAVEEEEKYEDDEEEETEDGDDS